MELLTEVPLMQTQPSKKRGSMLEKIAGLFIGIVLVFGGVQVFLTRVHKSVMWGRHIDYGTYHQIIGAIFMIGGLFIVYKEIRIMIRDRKEGRGTHKGD